MATELSLNVDHVATLRQARGGREPDPVEAAVRALDAGVSGITIHLREDRRHIQDDDLRRLRALRRGVLNLEMALTEEMVGIALRVRPDRVTLVPEKRLELTTEGGLDLAKHAGTVARGAARLRGAGIPVSLFLNPEPEILEPSRREVAAAASDVGRPVQGDVAGNVAVEHAAPRHRQRHHPWDAHVRHQSDDHRQRECDVLAAEPGFGGFHDFGLVGQQQCHGARHAHRVERFKGCVEDENSMHGHASGL